MISKNKLGIVGGGFFGLWHLVWSLLVAVGVAQALINFVFRLHFIQPPYVIAPFRTDLAIALIAITAIIGYVMGWVLAAIWNWLRPAS
jgi:hypothetical protein